MDKNTQQPVAWLVSVVDEPELGHWFAEEACSYAGHNCVPLYTAPPVPRDVLMAFGKEIADKAHAAGFVANTFTNKELASIADRYASQVQDDQPTVQDYEDVLADHRKLVRELDVLLNGEDGAAKQAKLCDIVAQVSRMKAQPEPVNQQLLAAIKSLVSALNAAMPYMKSFDNGGGPDCTKQFQALIDGSFAIAAAEAAQQEGEK